MKNLPFIFIIIIFACNNNTENTTKTSKDTISDTTIAALPPVDKFVFIKPIDSLMSVLYNEKLLLKNIESIDSIKLYPDVISAFNIININSMSYYHFPEQDLQRNEKGEHINLPGKIIILSYKTEQDAQNAFSSFTNDVLKHKLDGKMIFKPGGICFINEANIYALHISTCGDNSSIHLTEKIIRERIFNSQSFQGIKMYCSLSNVELIN